MVRIGDSIKRNEDPVLLRGMGNFVADINHVGQIYMKVVRSNIAFGKIRNINTDLALQKKGIINIWTSTDFNNIPKIKFRMMGFSELENYQQPILAKNFVRYVGEPIAVIFATDDMMGDIAADNGEENGDDNGDDKGDDAEEIEDRVVDLEDAIDDLKAEFEKMMSDKGEGDDDAEDNGEEEAIVSQDAEGEVEVAPELAPEEVIPAVEKKDNTPKSATEEIREYVNKVSVSHTDGSDNSASPVAKSGGSDAKADGKNLVQGGEEKGGKAPAPKEDNAGNVNTPGSNAGSKQSAAKANTADGTDGSAKKSAIGS